jgi:hypothetical protein
LQKKSEDTGGLIDQAEMLKDTSKHHAIAQFQAALDFDCLLMLEQGVTEPKAPLTF